MTFDDVVPSLQNEAGAELAFRSCAWFSTYRIHHRRAVRFRDRRCFLLGDAAHIHSPVGAQGMNTGLQDAYNLAWKLALVVNKQADAALLDSYEAERVPIAERLLNTTDRGFRLVVSDSWLAGLFRTKILARIGAFAMSLKRIQAFAFRTVSQTGIHYRWGPLSKMAEPLPSNAPLAGDRFPWLQLEFEAAGAREDSFKKLDDMHFHLIVVGQAAPEGVPGYGRICCACSPFPTTRPTARSSPARESRSHRSTSCARTATSDSAERAPTPRRSRATRPARCASPPRAHDERPAFAPRILYPRRDRADLSLRQNIAMKPFTLIAVVLLAVIGIVHLLRLFTGWEVVVNGFTIPVWISLPGAVVAGGLALMVAREARG